MNKYQKAKIIAIIGTVVFHTALLLFMLNVYLSREIPQTEEGLEVMLGMNETGATDFFEPTSADEIAQELEEVTPPEPTEPTPSDEAYQTQTIEESVEMKNVKSKEEIQKEKELAEKRRIEKQKQKEEQKRLAEERRKKAEEQRRQDSIRSAIAKRTSGLKGLGNGAGGSGTDATSNGTGGNSSGSKGNPFGNNTSKNTEGASNSGNNNSYSLSGRSPIGAIVRPTYTEQVEGKIIVSITVDKNGNVIDAHMTKGTTVDNAAVINAAIAAAKRTKFSTIQQDKPQVGIITYDLKLK